MEPPAGTSSGLPLTGERTVPGIPEENYWFRRHEVAYQAVADLCPGARVLEAGCGEGYGAARLLRAGARRVLGLDYDESSVTHAVHTYSGIAFVRGNLAALPLRADSFDLVVSLQTVEHLWDQPAFIRECARVLAPGGRLVLSTPNRRTFPPGNIFHSRELDAGELVALIEPVYRVLDVLGVQHGPRIDAYEAAHGSLVASQLAVPPHAWAPGLARLVADVSADDFVLLPGDLDTCLDLYLLAEPR